MKKETVAKVGATALAVDPQYRTETRREVVRRFRVRTEGSSMYGRAEAAEDPARVLEELFVRAHTLVAANRTPIVEANWSGGTLELYYTKEVRVEVKPEEPKP